jgi:hypothetical protein
VLRAIRRQVRRWRNWFADRRRSSRVPLRYELTRDGFKVLNNRHSKLLATLRWRDVHAIHAYRRDVFACYDTCLAFQLADDKWIEILEGNQNFAEVGARMQEVFPIAPRDWHSRVSFQTPDDEPFELYRREENGASRPHPTG